MSDVGMLDKIILTVILGLCFSYMLRALRRMFSKKEGKSWCDGCCSGNVACSYPQGEQNPDKK